MASSASLRIEQATEQDVPQILHFIRELAAYEKLLDRVEASEEGIREAIFGPDAYASAVFAYTGDKPVGFALFFYTYRLYGESLDLLAAE